MTRQHRTGNTNKLKTKREDEHEGNLTGNEMAT